MSFYVLVVNQPCLIGSHNQATAVKTQLWITVAVYLMVATHHKPLHLPGKLRRTWLVRPLLRIRYGQHLSFHPFKKAPIHELLTGTDF
jgi:hypothetical protein